MQAFEHEEGVVARSPLGPLLGTSMNDNGTPGKNRLSSSISNIVKGAVTGNFPGMAGAITNTVADGKAGKAADQAAAGPKAGIKTRSHSTLLEGSMRKVVRRMHLPSSEEETEEVRSIVETSTEQHKRLSNVVAARQHSRSFARVDEDTSSHLEKKGLGLKKGVMGAKVGKVGLMKGVALPIGMVALGPKGKFGAAPC